jgi:hypothetical protein
MVTQTLVEMIEFFFLDKFPPIFDLYVYINIWFVYKYGVYINIWFIYSHLN